MDASKEKHVPVIESKNGVVTVKVGAVAHPMEEKHYIPFVVLETSAGYQVRQLKPVTPPKPSCSARASRRSPPTSTANCTASG